MSFSSQLIALVLTPKTDTKPAHTRSTKNKQKKP